MGLSLGDASFTPLKTFLQRQAKSYQAQSFARTYGAFLGERVVAYMSLVCGEVVIGGDDTALVNAPDVIYRYTQYPAIKIARLAVDQRHRGQRLGQTLVDLALGIARDRISPSVGCRFVMVDAKQPSVNFYLKMGFTLLDTEANRARPEPVMFVDLHKTI